MRCLIAVVCLACLLSVNAAYAQQFIYDAKRDATAQDAAAAAKQVTSGALFETMLRNVDAQGKQQAETEMASIEQRMRAKLVDFITWHNPTATLPKPLPANLFLAGNCRGSVRCELESIEVRLAASASTTAITPEQLEKRLEGIEARRIELKDALERLQKANQSRDPFVIRAFALLQDSGQDAIEQAQALVKLAGEVEPAVAKRISTALDELDKGLDHVIAMYKAVAGIWQGYKAISVHPASLRPPQEQIDLQMLAVEQDHLKTLARIEARKQIEVGVALSRVTGVIAQMKTLGVLESTDQVEATLRASVADGSRLHSLVRMLHEAAAVVAQIDAAEGLARLRVADEMRRYSIRRSAINTSTYDQAIQAAVQRLALYWKSGIKPADLAQFAFYIANTVAIPAIAIKQD